MKARGFTLLELVIVVTIIAILGGFLLNRVLPLLGRAEKVAFMQVRSQIDSALLLEAAERITRGESDRLAELPGSNPMTLLLRPPANYLGTLPNTDTEDLPRAVWFFDERERELVYRPGRQAKFDRLDGPEDRIELVVSFVFNDANGNGAFDVATDEFDGLRLDPVHDFRWLD